jgi:hypothetical protein
MLNLPKGTLKHFSKLKNWFFDTNERLFIKNIKSKDVYIEDSSIKEVILIQCPNDYFYYTVFCKVIKKEQKQNSYKFHGISPNLFIVKQQFNYLYPFKLIISILNFHFLNKKWHKLYSIIGLTKIYKLNSVNFLEKPHLIFLSIKLWMKIKNKTDLLNLFYKDILIGDLIYDTYLRFRILPTVNINDPFLCYYIYAALKCHNSCENILYKNKVVKYFSSYTTYIQHGIPIRFFLLHHVEVYSSGNLQQLFKKLSLKDYRQTSFHENYYTDYLKLENKNELLNYSKKLLESKFNGNIDGSISYMKKSAFHRNSNNDFFNNFDGVLFLHDFYDSPHIYKNLIFNDFYEWVTHTLELINTYKLNIAVKPHPNQISESKKIIENLKGSYKNIIWLDANISNKVIFNSGINFGISVYGTVLHELAYFGINPICAGDNPHYCFNFIHKPNNIKEYDFLILNSANLQLPINFKELVEIFYLMHNINKKEDYHLEDINFDYDKRDYTSESLKFLH